MSIEPERALQCWDDLDDLAGAVALCSERIRRLLVFSIVTLLFVLSVAGGIALAFVEPPLAAALTVLLLVALMYRAVTGHVGLEINA